MAAPSKPMSEAVAYDLHGPGIEIKYHRGDLLVDSDDDLLKCRSFHRGDGNFSETPDEIGERITAVLLPSSRAGMRMSLSLILPDVGLTGDDSSPPATEVIGAAIITEQLQHLVGSRPAVLQHYEVLPLTGSVSRVAQPAAPRAADKN